MAAEDPIDERGAAARQPGDEDRRVIGGPDAADGGQATRIERLDDRADGRLVTGHLVRQAPPPRCRPALQIGEGLIEAPQVLALLRQRKAERDGLGGIRREP